MSGYGGSAGVIGWPVGQSKSPVIHRFWLGKLGLDGDYGRFPIHPDRLRAAIRALPALGLRGVNVTMPHKQAVIAHLDRLDPTAAQIGAVNTILVEDDALVGYNTDADGFLEPLRPLLARSHLFRLARIIGTGGAARAIAQALWGAGFTLIVIGRDRSKTEALLAPFEARDCHVGLLDDLALQTDFRFDDRVGILDLVVNASALGMAGQPPLRLDWSHVPPGAVVYDIVTAPADTPLLVQARARGHVAIDGLAMLIGQAALAFERFYGVAPPRAHDAELRALLGATR